MTTFCMGDLGPRIAALRRGGGSEEGTRVSAVEKVDTVGLVGDEHCASETVVCAESRGALDARGSNGLGASDRAEMGITRVCALPTVSDSEEATPELLSSSSESGVVIGSAATAVVDGADVIGSGVLESVLIL